MGFEVFLKMGDVSYKKKMFNEAIEHYMKALAIVEIQSDHQAQLLVREKITRSYYRLNNGSEALRHLSLLEHCVSGNDKIKIISLKAICFNLLGKFDDAIETISQLASFNDLIAKRKMLINLGSIYMRRGQFFSNTNDLKIANEKFLAALDITNEDRVRHKILRNLGICFNLNGKFSKSLDYFYKALDLANDDEFLVNYTYHELANSLINLGHYFKATTLLDYCLEISKRTQDNYALGLTNIQLGHLKFRTKDESQGERYFHSAIDYFLHTNSYAEISECYKCLSSYFSLTNPSKSQYYNREHKHYLHKLAV